MKVNILLAVILLGGCTTVQEDRMCLDWGVSIEQREKCVPVYGNMICAIEEKPRYWCKLYLEEETNE